MMDMQKTLTQLLTQLDIPISFVARGETKLPMVVFNYSEKPNNYEDDNIVSKKFVIRINLFSNTNYIDLKNKIEEIMSNAGFGVIEIPQSIYLEDISVFNQPFVYEYTYFYENND